MLAAYQADQEPLPHAGDHAVLVDGSGQPDAVIEATQVYADTATSTKPTRTPKENDRMLAG